jgi:xanthine dehydrogenase/oxidase
MKYGNSDKVFAETSNILEGEIKIGGQEHFYFETNAAIAIPKREDDELEVISSSQHPSELQVISFLLVRIKNVRKIDFIP